MILPLWEGPGLERLRTRVRKLLRNYHRSKNVLIKGRDIESHTQQRCVAVPHARYIMAKLNHVELLFARVEQSRKM